MWSFWKTFSTHLKSGLKSPLRYWVFLFVFFHLVAEHHGGTNPQSRLASLAAFSERGSFRLDPYYEGWTQDWARTPDGAYSSNKAPGPTFLALPLYLGFDALTQIGAAGPEAQRLRRHKTGHAFLRIASFAFQIIPWALLALISLSILNGAGYTLASQTIFLWAVLFGNTLSVFLNAYFGHGVGAVFLGLMAVAFFWQHLAWAGFFFGWALLSDYGSAALLPGILIVVLGLAPRIKRLSRFALGGVTPGILWVWYHTFLYGSPFALPNKFQNPEFVDLADSKQALWGVIDAVPSSEALYQLLFGLQRGLLATQPWVLVSILALLFIILKRRPASAVKRMQIPALALLTSFLGLYLMNASFGAWHAGASSGPRYLSIVLPSLALALPLAYQKASPSLKRLIYLTIVYSFAVNIAILCTSIIFGRMNLYDNLFHFFTHPNRLPTSVLRLSIFLIGLFVVRRKIRTQLLDAKQ